METIQGNLYDFPKYYDLVYGSDWEAEFDFLEDCFEKHTELVVERLFEPACGTGRLLVKLAEAEYEVGGLDLNAKAIAYCNARLDKLGYDAMTFVGDMSDFTLAKPVDAAFNTINSFRHLSTEQQARDHLQCIANCLRPGGLYVLGLHLTPTTIEPMQEESWSARRGNLAVCSRLWVEECDLKARQERVGMSFDVYTPTKQFRIVDEISFRIYTAPQMQKLLASVPELEIAAVYDFSYDIGRPVEIGPDTEDVVFVLRKCG
ncbi:class I SAM-dependent methyltransferase [Adhaeretor mobilis]|uniref:dTDP-3-amino-3,4, 6-trideoxy-alpha-D-glucopyranose n=1 Tax=Adhaeretor mobilis TaxID=1930276 RepID=A0A517N1V2_9BACT|nr:class I SAM-dependent methyltransferase [Adhaeretor mobilis]QDT01111.1 dTDP-3-amino-3,4,6-trideoxy-alpha-D-glucopyranose [Adhaeretor mobilis]